LKTNRLLLAALLISAATATFVYALVKRRHEDEDDSLFYGRPQGGETDPDGEAELFIGS
jgi:hypothetical protein